MPHFSRYLGIDYSGAETPMSSLPGLRIYQARPELPPSEVLPPPSPRKYWTRRGIAEWLASELRDGPPTLVGIDHAFSFPTRYFEVHRLLPDWDAFLDDFCQHWPTDNDLTYLREDRTPDQHDACSVARWMRESDAAGELSEHFATTLNLIERNTATIEGWILGLH